MVSKVSRQDVRAKKHERIRNRFKGTAERPRLAVFRSNSHNYCDILDILLPQFVKCLLRLLMM